jgi:hypothetical protein
MEKIRAWKIFKFNFLLQISKSNLMFSLNIELIKQKVHNLITFSLNSYLEMRSRKLGHRTNKLSFHLFSEKFDVNVMHV